MRSFGIILLAFACVPRALVSAEELDRRPRTAAEYIARARAAIAVPGKDHDDDSPGETAIALLTKALELEPDNVQALKLRAEASGNVLGDTYPAAIRDLDRVIALSPNDAEAYRERGKWFLISPAPDSKKRALADCRKAAELDATDAAAHACAADAYLRLKDRPRAEGALAKACALNPRDALLRTKRAQNLLRMSRLEEALRECDASLAIDPNDCRLVRAEILRGLHRDKEAAQDQAAGGRRSMKLIQNTGTAGDRTLIKEVLDRK